MEKTAMTRYSDVFNTLKDHDNEISSPGAGFTAGRMLNKDTSSRCASTAARYWYGKSGVSVLSGERGEQIPVQSPQGVRTECKLPGGEVIDEWDLYRRDHPQPTR